MVYIRVGGGVASTETDAAEQRRRRRTRVEAAARAAACTTLLGKKKRGVASFCGVCMGEDGSDANGEGGYGEEGLPIPSGRPAS